MLNPGVLLLPVLVCAAASLGFADTGPRTRSDAESAAAGQCCTAEIRLGQAEIKELPKLPMVEVPKNLPPIRRSDEGLETFPMVPPDRLSPTPPTSLSVPHITGLSPKVQESGHMNPGQSLTIVGIGFDPSPLKTRVGLRTFSKDPIVPPRSSDFVGEMIVQSAASKKLVAKLPTAVKPGTYLVWTCTDGAGHSNAWPLVIVAPRTVRVSKIEQDKCKSSVRFHLDRAGGYWKGTTNLILDGRTLQVQDTSSISQTLKVGKSDKLYGRLNVPVSVSVLDPVAVPANSIGMVSVSFPKFPPLRAVSVLPSDIKAGSTAKVTVRFGNYDLDDGPVGLTVVPGTALSVGVTKNYKAKVNNWAVGGKIEATITASPSASAGARLLRLSAECREPGTLPFSVVVTKPPAPPPPAVTTTNIVYSKHVPFQGQYAYKAWVSIPNAKLQTVKNPDLGLGKQWLVRIPKSAKVGSEDCNKSAADFVNLDPGQSTTAFNGISMYQWGSWVCLVPKSQFTLVQGYPPKWTLEMSYTK